MLLYVHEFFGCTAGFTDSKHAVDLCRSQYKAIFVDSTLDFGSAPSTLQRGLFRDVSNLARRRSSSDPQWHKTVNISTDVGVSPKHHIDFPLSFH